MENKIIFVIGGCRSGKSDHALELANAVNAGIKIFVATSVPADGEMEERVQKHQSERGDDWQTIEEPIHIDQVIDQHASPESVILIDCLTLWASNILFKSDDPERIENRIQQLEKSLKQRKGPVFLVSNEVGMGIVPENKLARQFRDLAGMINRRVAQSADKVILTVAGIPVQIKPKV